MASNTSAAHRVAPPSPPDDDDAGSIAEGDAASGYALLSNDLVPCSMDGNSSDGTLGLEDEEAAGGAVPYGMLPAHAPRAPHHVGFPEAGFDAVDAPSSKAGADDDACSVHASSESSDDVIGGLLYEKAELSLRVAELEAQRDAWEAKITELMAENTVLKAAAAVAAQPGRSSSSSAAQGLPPASLDTPDEAGRIEHLMSANDHLESRLTALTAEVAAVHCQNKILQAQLSSSSGSGNRAGGVDDSDFVQLLAGDQPKSVDNAELLEPLVPLIQQQHTASAGWEPADDAVGGASAGNGSAGGVPVSQLRDLQALVSQQAELIESLHNDVQQLREQNDVWESRVTTYAGENAVLAIKVKGLEASLAKHRQLLATGAAAGDAAAQALHLQLLDGVPAAPQLHLGSASPSVQQHVLVQGTGLVLPAAGVPMKQHAPPAAAADAAKGVAALQMMWSGQLGDADDAAEGDWQIQAAMLNADIRSISSSGNSTTSSASTSHSTEPGECKAGNGMASGPAASGCAAMLVQPKRAADELSDQLTASQVAEADLRTELRSLQAQCTGMSDSISDIDQLVLDSMACLSMVQQHAKLL